MYKVLFFMVSFLICQGTAFDEGISYYNNRHEGANGLIPSAPQTGATFSTCPVNPYGSETHIPTVEQ